MTKKTLLLLFILIQFIAATAQDSVTVKEYMKIFPTYPFSDPNPIPLLTQVYPYFRFDGFTDRAVNKGWKVVEIENAYIKIMILPEIGGKIWAAIDKKTNKPFLYYNHTVKFRDIAMRGPWTSGGLESNFGIVGHTPNCASPVDYIVQHKEDGSVSCTIGTLDLLTRSNWRIEINVPKDKAYFSTQAFWYNNTALEQPYYHWMNAAAKASNDLEFIYPGNKYLGHNGEYASWPVNEQNGKNISWYKNNDFGGYKSYHVWGKYTHFFGTYYHDEDAGMARYSAHDDKAGKKIWIWGLSDQGMMWEKELTDTDGQYVEIQSGRLFNQNAEMSSYTPFKHIALTPYQSDSWKEYWYPVLGTKGFVEANEYGAFNTKYEDGWLKLYYFPVQRTDDELVVKEGTKIIYQKALHLLPEQVFTDSVRVVVDKNKLTATMSGSKLNYTADSTANNMSRPVQSPDNFNWNSAYGLYVSGSELMDQKLFANAEEKLSASLQKDSGFLPALVKMSELMYRNMRYAEALKLATRALSINSVDGSANYYYGLIQEQLGNTVDAKDGFDIASLDPAYRSAAYTELASVYFKEKSMDNAMHYSNQSLVYNTHNIAALQLQSVIYRYTLANASEQKTLAVILNLDPLNQFALYEQYKLTGKEEDKQKFVQSIRSELPSETYEELAVWYYRQGCKQEAMELFTLSPANPVVTYWLSFLRNEKLDTANIDPAFSFPFRSETAAVIETLLATNSNWLLKYHLALIYHDRNRITECKQLLSSCGNNPPFAPFYAMRAAIESDSDKTLAEADYLRALLLNKDWRYYKLLSDFYIANRQYSKALQTIEPYAKSHPQNYITGLLYTKALLFTNKLNEADNVISNLSVLPFEGATESHDIYREIKLKKAIAASQNKNYKQCVNLIQEAELYPARLGVGRPYEEDIDNRLEDWLSYFLQVAIKKNTDTLLQKIIRFNSSPNSERNIQTSNALVTVWAYTKLNQKEKGIQWLNNQLQLHPADKWLLWTKSMLENSSAASYVQLNSNARILTELINSNY